MALLLVLTVASVVVMTTGAFVMANSVNFTSLSASRRQREADLVTASALEFLYFQLESDQTFARQPFSDEAEMAMRGGLRVRHVKNPGKAVLQGAFLDESATGSEPTFTAEIVNRLDRNGSGKVQADTVLLSIVGRSGAFTSRCDALFRGEPLFDASLTANRLVALNRNESVKLLSRDPARNWLRSNGDILLNGFAQGQGTTTISSGPGSPQGVVWAKGEIFSEGEQQGLSGEKLARASQAAGGLLAPRSRLNHDIYKLTPADLSVFKQDETKASQSVGRMRAGTYSVEWAKVYWQEEGATRSKDVKSVSFTPSDYPQSKKIYWYDGRSLDSSNLVLPEGWESSSRCDEDGVVQLGGTNVNTADGQNVAAMTYRFDDDAFVTDDSSIEVEGDFRIISQIDGLVPSISLKSNESSTGVIRATKGGSIVIQGTLSGGGALVADQDIQLMSNPKLNQETNVEADKSAGVVLYGGGNVSIFGGANRAIQFKGLIYAEKDVSIYGGLKVNTRNGRLSLEGTADTLDVLDLQGAVVARSGSVDIAGTKNVSLTYDPDYLQKLTKGMPENRRRISRLWVRRY
ncbi:hypothetical protein ABS71_02915 [bacterium SCN 62-11]|nr:MAG: hypothetical protein ABS71_02915 [bacterium SCN 62-11]